MDIHEPIIVLDDILTLADDDFHSGHVCLVSGVGTGIGRAVALVCAVNGLTVLGLDVNKEQAGRTQSMARDLGSDIHFLPTDLGQDGDIEHAVQTAADMGQIKYLFNIAGIQHVDSVQDFPMHKYDQMQRLMLRAPFYLSKLSIPYMQASPDGCGVIGHMASVHSHITTKNKAVYNITKFGLRALSQSISAEGEGRIRSFTVSTGYVRTPLALNQIPYQAKQRGISQEEVVRDVMMGHSRVKEMMSPVEVANIFLFGMSKHSRYLVGGDLLFDGGMVLTY
jgi:3-hydroxybutyrate dehydrogenase